MGQAVRAVGKALATHGPNAHVLLSTLPKGAGVGVSEALVEHNRDASAVYTAEVSGTCKRGHFWLVITRILQAKSGLRISHRPLFIATTVDRPAIPH